MPYISVLSMFLGGVFAFSLLLHEELRKRKVKQIVLMLALFFSGLFSTVHFWPNEQELKPATDGIFIAAHFPGTGTTIHFYDISDAMREKMYGCFNQQKTLKKFVSQENILPGIRFKIYEGYEQDMRFIKKIVIHPNRFDPPVSYDLALDEEWR